MPVQDQENRKPKLAQEKPKASKKSSVFWKMIKVQKFVLNWYSLDLSTTSEILTTIWVFSTSSSDSFNYQRIILWMLDLSDTLYNL